MLALLFLSVLLFGVVGGGRELEDWKKPRLRKPFVPPLKKGFKAWDNAKRGIGVSALTGPHTLRSIVHGVNDTTNRMYLREVRALLRNCMRHNLTLGSPRAVDKALAKEIDELMYVGRDPVGYGQRLYWGVCHIWPDLEGELRYARRSLRTWERLQTVGENVPARKRTLYLVFNEMARRGWGELAFVGYLALDCYLRGMDWDLLAAEDVYIAGDRATLKFGRRHRGERSKTGKPEQGVSVEQGWIARVLKELKARIPGNQKLFATSRSEFRKAWWFVLRLLALTWLGPPHVIRHTAASHDVAEGLLSLEETRRRGRWSQIKSVERYAKAHDLILHDSQLTPDQVDAGLEAEKDVVGNFHRALVAGGNSYWANLVAAAMES